LEKVYLVYLHYLRFHKITNTHKLTSLTYFQFNLRQKCSECGTNDPPKFRTYKKSLTKLEKIIIVVIKSFQNSILQELLVDGHELDDEGLDVVDSLLTSDQAMFILGGKLDHITL